VPRFHYRNVDESRISTSIRSSSQDGLIAETRMRVTGPGDSLPLAAWRISLSTAAPQKVRIAHYFLLAQFIRKFVGADGTGVGAGGGGEGVVPSGTIQDKDEDNAESTPPTVALVTK
jgi:hypothetical protein